MSPAPPREKLFILGRWPSALWDPQAPPAFLPPLALRLPPPETVASEFDTTLGSLKKKKRVSKENPAFPRGRLIWLSRKEGLHGNFSEALGTRHWEFTYQFGTRTNSPTHLKPKAVSEPIREIPSMASY